MRRLLFLFFAAFALASCSVVQATTGPPVRNLDVLSTGNHRHTVIGEIGEPLISETNSSGNKVDVFKFQQGTHGLIRAGKAVGYGLLAIGSLGLSELLTSPVEGEMRKGAEIQLRVIYSKTDRVEQVDVLKDERWIPIQEIKSKKPN